MSTHNICFLWRNKKNIIWLPPHVWSNVNVEFEDSMGRQCRLQMPLCRLVQIFFRLHLS